MDFQIHEGCVKTLTHGLGSRIRFLPIQVRLWTFRRNSCDIQDAIETAATKRPTASSRRRAQRNPGFPRISEFYRRSCSYRLQRFVVYAPEAFHVFGDRLGSFVV